MRRYRRFWGFRCPPSIITGIFLALGCSRKSEGNKFILLAEGLEFFPRILVYLHVDVHPYMESWPRQMRAQTGRLSLTNPRRGKNPNGGNTRVRARSPFCLGTGPAVFCWRLRITGMGPLHVGKDVYTPCQVIPYLLPIEPTPHAC